MLLSDQFILAAMQQPSRTANLSKARQGLIEVHTRIWQVELREKSGELVDRSAADRQFFSLVRNVGDNYQNLPARTSGLVAAERDQQSAATIFWRRRSGKILEGLTRGYGNGVDDALLLHLAEPLRTKSDIDPIARIYRTARKSSSRLLTRRIDRYPSALHHTCIHNSVLMRL